MATANPTGTHKPVPLPSGSRLSRVWLWRGLGGLMLLIALLLLVFWGTIHRYAMAGTAFGAHLGCTCHYLGGRTLKDCRKDFEPGMSMIFLSADAKAKSVTARFPLIASQTATLRDGAGCALEKWPD